MDESKVVPTPGRQPGFPQAAEFESLRTREADGAGTRAEFRVTDPDRLLRLLTKRNVALLALIRSKSPRSLSELSVLSGRPKASLTRTLKRFRALGIVNYRKAGGRAKAPIVACDCVRLDVPLDAIE
jgi:predicted transcriptional regulator